MGPDWKTPTEDVSYLLDMILEHIPAPKKVEGTLQMRITSLDYSSFQGRIAVGRVRRGTIKPGQNVSLVKNDGRITKGKVAELMVFEGLGKEKVKDRELYSGELCAIMGLEGFDIGDTVADFENPEGLPGFKVDEPTMSMLFTINTSPFFGKEGDFVTSRHLRDRLFKEIEKNLAMRVEETNSPDKLLVYGRGILHIGILVETMRREGYEFQLGQPQVIYKEIDGERCEPIEMLTVQVPEAFSSKVIDLVSRRKGEIAQHGTEERPRTRGVQHPGARHHRPAQPVAYRHRRARPSSHTASKATSPTKANSACAARPASSAKAQERPWPSRINKLQDRGKFFVDPGEEIYGGQVIGENPKTDDLVVNVLQGQAAHQHARQRHRQQGEHRTCREVLLGRVHGVHRRRRVPGGDAQEPAHAQDPAGRERPQEGR